MARFRVVLEPGQDGWWVVSVPSLPGCISQGKTREDALANIREAIELYIDATNERPASEASTTQGEDATVEV